MPTISRREVLKTLAGLGLLLVAGACNRGGFKRPAAVVDLGVVADILTSKTHVPLKSMLVYRSDSGWSAMSTRCSYDGCDLTYQESTLLCMCCRSVFDHAGHVKTGRAKVNLPWYAMSYADGHLYADTGKPVDENYVFTTDELEVAVKELKEQLQLEGNERTVKIPEILLGKEGDDTANMFVESPPIDQGQ